MSLVVGIFPYPFTVVKQQNPQVCHRPAASKSGWRCELDVQLSSCNRGRDPRKMRAKPQLIDERAHKGRHYLCVTPVCQSLPTKERSAEYRIPTSAVSIVGANRPTRGESGAFLKRDCSQFQIDFSSFVICVTRAMSISSRSSMCHGTTRDKVFAQSESQIGGHS